MRPPGYNTLGAIGAARRLLSDPRELIAQSSARFGPIWRMKIPGDGGLKDLIWLIGPAGNERILAPPHRDDFSWRGGYAFTMQPTFGDDILLLLDDTPACPAHKTRHRTLVSAFHPRTDVDYANAIVAIVQQHSQHWRAGDRIDLDAAIKKITLHVITALLFGATQADQPEIAQRFEAIGRGLFSVLRWRIPGTDFARGQIARRALGKFLRVKIAAARAGENPRNMLGSLLGYVAESGEPLPDETLVSELIAFLFAGYDTTASFLVSFFAAIATRPAIRDALIAESRVPNASQLVAPQLDAALAETERLFPPLVFNMRSVTRAFEHAGYRFSPGDRVAYSPYATGRLPELWENADSFLPERFTSGQKYSPYALCGFGAGHRACIGKRFALNEMRLIIQQLLSRFSYDVLPGQSDAMYFNPAMQRKHCLIVELR